MRKKTLDRSEPISEAELFSRITGKFPAPQYVVLPQVADGTGRHKERTADALAMSPWPSRGLILHGFECKRYRGDWLHEMRNPRKAESIFAYCDHWWLVIADDRVAKLEEIPATWGLLQASGKGLKTIKAAPRLAAKDLDRSFLAAVLRNLTLAVVFRHQIADQIAAARQEAENRLGWEHKRLKERVDSFETKSGMKLESLWSEEVAKAAALMQDHGLDYVIRSLQSLGDRATELGKNLSDALKKYRKEA